MIRGDQLLVPGTELVRADTLAPHAPGSYEEAVDRALRRVLEPHSQNTQRTYRQAWRQWEEHCDERGFIPWPLEPKSLISYLDFRTDLAPNTVRTYYAALCARDLEVRMAFEENPLSVRTHPAVIRWFESWSRDHSREPRKQAPAATRNHLARILEAMQQRGRRASSLAHLPMYLRDRCILIFGLTGGFRGAELVALDLADVAVGERGVDVRVRRAKNNQHGEARYKCLHPQGQILRCPVDAWQSWLRVRGEAPGPAFHPIARSGALEQRRMSVETVRDMIRARAEAAGVRLSSHSLRAGFVTMSRQRGKPLDRIAAQAGMASLETARRYCRNMELWEDNPSAGLLDD